MVTSENEAGLLSVNTMLFMMRFRKFESSVLTGFLRKHERCNYCCNHILILLLFLLLLYHYSSSYYYNYLLLLLVVVVQRI